MHFYPKSIDRNIVTLGWVSFFTDFATAMIVPIMPIFIVTVLGAGMDTLGMVVAIATFASYGVRLVSGYISDRYGIVKPLVVAGYLLSALSKPLFFFSQSITSVALLQGAERIGKGLRSAPKDFLIAHYSPHRRKGRSFGFHKTLDIAGELSGTLFLFFLLWSFGQSETLLRSVFLGTIIPGAIGVVLMLFFVKDVPKTQTQPLRPRLTSGDRKVLKTLSYYFAFLVFSFSDAFFTMRSSDVGIETMMIPLLFVVSTATQTLFSYPIGRLIDTVGYKQVNAGAFVSGVVAQLLLLEGSATAIWSAYLFLGLFTVASLNANRAFIAQHADNRGSVYGVFYAATAIFAGFGALVVGFLWEHSGATDALIFSLCGSGAVTALYLLFYRKHP